MRQIDALVLHERRAHGLIGARRAQLDLTQLGVERSRVHELSLQLAHLTLQLAHLALASLALAALVAPDGDVRCVLSFVAAQKFRNIVHLELTTKKKKTKLLSLF